MPSNRWTCAIAALLVCLGLGLPAAAQQTPTPRPTVRIPQACTPGAVVTGVSGTGLFTCVSLPGGGDMLREIYDADLDGEVTTAEIARALIADPVACGPGLIVSDIAADGTLTCIPPPAATTLDSGTAFPGSPGQGRVFIVVDDAVAGNCTSTGGTASSLCIWNGSAWVPPDRVLSVHGRLGAVVAADGDYLASQVTNTPAGAIAATNVQTALNELDAEKSALAHVHAGADITTGALGLARLTDGATAGFPLIAGGAGGDPTYTVLGVAGIDATVIQRRASGTCAVGFSIRIIAEDGTVTCEEDTVGGGGGGYDTVQTDGGSVAKTAAEQLRLVGGFGITTSGAEGTPDDVTIAADDADLFTQAEANTHTADVNAHHAQNHATRHSAGGADPVSVENLATAGGSGTAPVSGGAGTLAMTNIATQAELDTHAGLPNVHHTQVHSLTGSDHTLAGASDGMVLQATSASTFEVDWPRLRSAADCTALTDGEANEPCMNTTGLRLLFVCRPTAGGCDTGAEWNPLQITEAEVTFRTNDGARHQHVPADVEQGTAAKCARFDTGGVLVAATQDCPNGDTGGAGGSAQGGTGDVQFHSSTAGQFAGESAYDYDAANNHLTIGLFGATPEQGRLTVVPASGTGGFSTLLEGTSWCSPDATTLANCQGITLQAPDTIGTNRTVLLEDDTTPLPGSAMAAGGTDITGAVSALVVVDDSHSHTSSTISALDTGDVTTGSFADARVDGTAERNEVTPEWNVVVDCTTAATFGGTPNTDTCQDRFYDAIEPIVTAADVTAFNALMPYRVKVVLSNQTCTPDDATDYGDFRVCLGVFPSGAYSGNRPTAAAKEFVGGVSHGAFQVHFEGSRLAVDATSPSPGGATHSDQAEPIVPFMVGSGSIAGYVNFDVAGQCTGAGAPQACCTGAGTGNGTGVCAQAGGPGQYGEIVGIKLSGHLVTASNDSRHDNAADPDWNTAAGGAGRRPITAHFEDSIFSSRTSVVGWMINAHAQLDMSEFSHTHQHSGGDWDDLGFACTSLSFSNTALGSEIIMSGNGVWLGPTCNLQFQTFVAEATSGSSDRQGVILDSPPTNATGSKIPMSSSCASGNCNARFTSQSPQFHSSVLALAEGYRTVNFASMGGGFKGEFYNESNIPVLTLLNAGCTAADVPWDCCTASGAGTCIPADFIVGYGTCASDASICTENADCPVNAGCTGAGVPWPCCSGSGAGVCSPDASANGECTAAGTPYYCCTGSGTGNCQNSHQCQGMGINSQADSDIGGSWTRSMLGFGPNAKSPYPTSAGATIGQFKLHTDGGPNTNNECTGSGAPFACCTGSGTGTCADFKVHSALTNPPTLDFTGLNAGPVKVPATYPAQVTPQIQIRTDATCTGLTNGVLGEFCIDPAHKLWRCDPDAGPGTSNHVCDTANDWIGATVGPTVETAEITDGQITGDDIASSIAGSGLVLSPGSPDVLDVQVGLGLRISSDVIGFDPTAALSGDHTLNAGEAKFGANGMILEGATSDAIETFVSVTNPTTTDKTFTIPDANTIAVQPITCGGTDKVSGINATTGVVTCTNDATGAGGGDAISVEDGDNAGTSTAMTDALFEDSADINFVRTAGTPDEVKGEIRTGAVGEPELAANSVTTSEVAFNYVQTVNTFAGLTGGTSTGAEGAQLALGLDYTQTLAGNPPMNEDECMFTVEGTSGGGVLCQGGATASNEQLHLFPAQDGADTTDYIATGDSTGAALNVVDGAVGDADIATGAVDGGSGGEIADASITYEDLANTDTLGGNPAHGASSVFLGTTGILFEGATSDTIEGLLTAADPTGADKTWTLPDATGTLALIAGDIAAGSEVTQADALEANAANCSAGQYAQGIDTTGAAEGCTADDDVPDTDEVASGAIAANAVTPGKISLLADLINWSAGSMSVDGAECNTPTERSITNGPKGWTLDCDMDATDTDGFVFGDAPLPADIDVVSDATFNLHVRLNFDGGAATIHGLIEIQCRATTETPSSTWDASAQLDITEGINDAIDDDLLATSATIDLATCGANERLYWRYKVCDDDLTPSTGCSDNNGLEDDFYVTTGSLLIQRNPQ